MEKKYFPLFVDLTEKKIVVIGGGTIASRRIKTMTEFADNILVVAPEITQVVEEFVKDEKVCWLREEYRVEHLKNADIVIAATNQPEVNHQVLKDIRLIEQQENRNILVNVIDDKERCDFYFPGIVKKEDIVIGISSCGTSPTKSKQLRQNMEEWLSCDSVY